MLKKRIIPCLDVQDGRVVKGVSFCELRDAGDPVEQAITYDREGADEVCFLDISASPRGHKTVLDIVKQTAKELFVPLTVGGGVRNVFDAGALLEAGADKVAINTAALSTPSLIDEIAKAFGTQALVVAVDAKKDGTGYEVYSHGGRTVSNYRATTWCREVADRGAGEILLTSMDRDGTGLGYELELTSAVSKSVPIPVIASGGVGSLDHLKDGFTLGGADAALAASIFHFGKFSISEAKTFLKENGVLVRPL